MHSTHAVITFTFNNNPFIQILKNHPLRNLSIVRNEYRHLPDRELLRVAKEGMPYLSNHHIKDLQEELAIRHLDDALAESNKAYQALRNALALSAFNKSANGILSTALWKLIFDWKAQGKSDEVICELLVAQNIHAEYATILVSCIEPQLESSIEQLTTETYAGYIPAGLGIAVLLWVWVFTLAPAYLLIGLVLLLAGSLKLYHVLPRKRKLQSILQKIQNSQ